MTEVIVEQQLQQIVSRPFHVEFAPIGGSDAIREAQAAGTELEFEMVGLTSDDNHHDNHIYDDDLFISTVDDDRGVWPVTDVVDIPFEAFPAPSRGEMLPKDGGIYRYIV